MLNYEELPTDVENELADFHANSNSNGRDSGPDSAPDVKKAIRVVGDLLVDKFDVQYDWHEVLEIRLGDGRWVMVTLAEIEDPTPKDE